MSLMPKTRRRCRTCRRVHTGPGPECHACGLDRAIAEDTSVRVALDAEERERRGAYYTPEKRAEIRAYARVHGVAAASRELGAGEPTIRRWLATENAERFCNEVDEERRSAAGGEG